MFRCFFLALLLSFGQFAQAETLLDVNFNRHTVGNYNFNRLDRDFDFARSVRGITATPPLNRASIVSGNVAFEGQSLAVNCRDRGFVNSGAHWFAELNGSTNEAYLSYRMRFEDGFNFTDGIKLLGLVGGTAPEGATRANGANGWMTRIMLRPGTRDFGRLISIAKYLQSGPANSPGAEDFRSCRGADGELTIIEPEKWYRVIQRVRLNSVGQADGVLQVWLDGELVLDQDDVVFRNVAGLEIDQFNFSCFANGGMTGPTQEQFAYFDDIQVTTPQNIFVPDDYGYITTAVNNSSPGDTIYVRPGQHLVGANSVNITHPLTINGSFVGDTNVRGTLVDQNNDFGTNAFADAVAADRVDPPVFDVQSANVILQQLNVSVGNSGIRVNANRVEVEIRNVSVDRARHGLFVEPNCHRLKVISSSFTNNLNEGVEISGCDDILIARNQATGNGQRGFLLDECDDADILRNMTSFNSRVRAFQTFFVADSGFRINDSEGVVFRANDIQNNRFFEDRAIVFGVRFERCRECILSSNTIVDSDLVFRSCDSMLVMDNELIRDSIINRPSIELSSTDNSIIRDNFIDSLSGTPIQLDFSDNNRVNANVIICLLYTSPSPRDATLSRMPSSA